MSYIDCFDHKILGFIGGIAVYQALQDIAGDDFQCKKNQVIIGGGSGEHPAAVINDLTQAIYMSLTDEDEDIEIDELDGKDIHHLNNLIFFDWSCSDYVYADKIARENGFTYEVYPTVEYWLTMEAVKLVLKEAPELIDECLVKYIQK